MPVIACPDCGRDVSTLAPACPHCGRPSPGGTAVNTSTPQPSHEETLWRGTPSPRVLVGQLIGLLVLVVAIPSIAIWASHMTADLETSSRIAKIGWVLTAVVVAVEVVRLIAAVVRIRSTLYTVTNQRIIVERGMLSKSLSEIDLRTIDDTQFFQSVVARMLGIGNVTLVSSDKSAPLFVLENVPEPRNLRETIRTHAYQVSQRQLFTRQA